MPFVLWKLSLHSFHCFSLAKNVHVYWFICLVLVHPWGSRLPTVPFFCYCLILGELPRIWQFPADLRGRFSQGSLLLSGLLGFEWWLLWSFPSSFPFKKWGRKVGATCEPWSTAPIFWLPLEPTKPSNKRTGAIWNFAQNREALLDDIEIAFLTDTDCQNAILPQPCSSALQPHQLCWQNAM